MDLIVCLDKPENITSRQAADEVKKRLKVKKAGHTGTLDPIATGLLIVCTDKATRLTSLFAGFDKTYDIRIKFGQATDTMDRTGTVVHEVENFSFSERKLKNVLNTFTGKIKQVPPMYSAKKVNGKPLYTLARKGIEIERQAKEVIISYIELKGFNLPYSSLIVRCSSGTYIRTLCDDIGKSLGCGAHLSDIRRISMGNYTVDNAVSLDELNSESKGIHPPDRALSWMPEIKIKPSALKKVKNGNPLRWGDISPPIPEVANNAFVRVKAVDETLLAIGAYSGTPPLIIKMKIVF
jgi:tRNA pseudouridine55 synthase